MLRNMLNHWSLFHLFTDMKKLMHIQVAKFVLQEKNQEVGKAILDLLSLRIAVLYHHQFHRATQTATILSLWLLGYQHNETLVADVENVVVVVVIEEAVVEVLLVLSFYKLNAFPIAGTSKTQQK